MFADAGARREGSNRATVIVVGICWLTLVFEGYDLIVYGTVVPSLLGYDDWSLTPTQAGAIGSYMILGMLFGALVVGTITDMVGRRKTVIGCLSWFSVAMALCAISPSPELLGLFRFLAGLGLGGVIPTATALTMEYAPAGRRTFTYALMFSGYSFGGILAASLAIPLIPAFGWRVMFLLGAIPLFLVVPVALKFLPESMGFLLQNNRTREAEALARRFGMSLDTERAKIADTVEEAAAPRRLAAISTLFSRNYLAATLCFWIATFLALFMIFGINTWLPQIMRTAGYSLGSALSFLLVLNLGTMIGTIVMGVAMDRWGSKLVCAISFLLAAAALGLMSTNPPLLVLPASATAEANDSSSGISWTFSTGRTTYSA